MTDSSPLVRTDFSSDEGWREAVRQATAETEDGFRAELDPIDDRVFEGKSYEALSANERWKGKAVLFVVDTHTIEDCECSIACVDLGRRPGGMFRAVPSALWGVENNLRLGNMDFEEFASAVGEDGIFRGF